MGIQKSDLLIYLWNIFTAFLYTKQTFLQGKSSSSSSSNHLQKTAWEDHAAKSKAADEARAKFEKLKEKLKEKYGDDVSKMTAAERAEYEAAEKV
jgi:hypothetical protein